MRLPQNAHAAGLPASGRPPPRLPNPAPGLNPPPAALAARLLQGTSSALIPVFIRNGRLAEAQSLYRSLRAEGQWPDLYALNALLNAYANAFRWGLLPLSHAAQLSLRRCAISRRAACGSQRACRHLKRPAGLLPVRAR